MIRILTNGKQFKVQKSEIFITTKERKELKYFIKKRKVFFEEATYNPVYETITEKHDELFWYDVNDKGEKYQEFIYPKYNPEPTNQKIAVFNTLKSAEMFLAATYGLILYNEYLEKKKKKENNWVEV